jgi:hypothetical protein
MTTRSANFQVPPLALYIMAVARWDVSVTVLERYIKKDWFPIPPRWYQGFKEEAERFGHPPFSIVISICITDDIIKVAINSRHQYLLFRF